MELNVVEVESPVGTIVMVEREGTLCALDFADCRERMTRLLEARFGDVRLGGGRDRHGLGRRMRDYLDGNLRALEGLTTDTGGTPFQRKVWNALQKIPAGKTRSYGELAVSIGKPSAVRAVGMANSRNPIGIVIPCHRVIGADGSLTGYAGGLERKRWLLRHEKAMLCQPSLFSNDSSGRKGWPR